MVRPTMSGMMVESLDHVLMMRFSDVRVAAATFFASDGLDVRSLLDRSGHASPSYRPEFRRRTMNLSDCFLPRVRWPNVGLPHGVCG